MKYATIVADPPWEHIGTGGKKAGWRKDWDVAREQPLAYESLPVDEIAGVRVPAAKDARLFLWATNARLPDAFRVMAEWGFIYRQTCVWHKPDVNPVGGSVAPNAEFLLVGTIGSPSVIERWPNAVVSHPRGGLVHSQKPEIFLDLAEQSSPGPYLELFARRNRLGWDTWGNESLGLTELTVRSVKEGACPECGNPAVTRFDDGRRMCMDNGHIWQASNTDSERP